MAIKNFAIWAAAILSTPSLTFAGAMGEISQPLPRFYVGIEGGYSMSAEAHLQPVPRIGQRNFTIPDNTDWSRNIGSSGLGGAYIGYQWNPNVALQLSYAYRSAYNWTVLVNSATLFPTDPYEMYIARNIRIQTLLVDLLLKPAVDWGGFVPYVKGGIGASNNRIRRVIDADIPLVGSPLSFGILLKGRSSTNFAWNIGVGADYFITDKLSVGFGYRFVDTGKLETTRNFIDPIVGEFGLISRFKARDIFLHEVVATVAYHFDWA